MTAPRSNTGYVQLQGGYTPHAPQGTPGYQPPQQTQQPQGQPQQFQQPPLPWQNPAGPGAPMEGAPPPQPQPQQPVQQQPQQQFQQPPVQPQQQPPAPQAPQGTQQQLQNLANQGVDLNARLNGANVPTELQGRTLGEALQLYNGMRNVVLQQTAPKPQQTQPQPQAQPSQQQEEWNWRNPQASIAKIVQEQLAPLSQALQPIVLNTQVQQMRTVRDQVAATIPNFAAIEGQVMESLRGADPQVLLNPQAWRLAAESVVGRMALQGQQVPAAQQPAQQPPNPWMQPAQRPGPGQQPMPNLSGFFTEQPTSGAPNAAPQQLTATQQWAAQQMGMSNEDYMAWSAGVPGGAR